jgi:hypothetical protein
MKDLKKIKKVYHKKYINGNAASTYQSFRTSIYKLSRKEQITLTNIEMGY